MAMVDDTIPTGQTIAQAAKLEVLDINGDRVKFGSVFESQKAIVVFIRHFFCGACQQYVMQLASSEQALSDANAKIVVIGCGDWQAIKAYSEITDFKGALYTDPTRTLFRALGMTLETLDMTPTGTQKKSYLQRGYIANVLKSIWTGPLQHPTLAGKQGNISQLGGDFILGPGDVCSFAHRMQNTEDHVEAADLMKAARVTYP